MSINKFRTKLYLMNKLLGDVQAVNRAHKKKNLGPIGKRIGRRLFGKLTGRLMGKIFPPSR